MAHLYIQFPPHSQLAPFVAALWYSVATPGTRETHLVLPDCQADLICRIVPQGQQLFLVGTMTQALPVTNEGSAVCLGIRFRPGGLAGFLPFPLHAVTDQTLDLAEFMHVQPLIDLLGGKDEPLAKLQAFEAFLLNHFDRRPAIDRRLAAATQMLDRDPQLSVTNLSNCLGLSRQYLRRIFLDLCGLSPKQYARMSRLRMLASQMSRPSGGLSTLALTCGYYDQAHMNNEFRHIVGLSPTIFMERHGILSS